MNLVDNSKQNEFLLEIRRIGMAVVFKKITPQMVIDAFVDFLDYIEDEEVALDYADSILKIYYLVSDKKCTPDDVLLELGQYTPDIHYDDEDIDFQDIILDNEDQDANLWFYN